MTTLWNPEAFKPASDFKNIMAIDGDVVSITEGTWPENEFNKKPQDYTEITLENVANIVMKGEAEAPKLPDGVYRFRFNQSDKENSLNHAFVVDASKLTTELPDGLLHKRIHFEKNIVKPAKGQQQEWSVLTPREILTDYAVKIEDVVRTLLEAGNDIKAFKRASLMNAQVNSSEYMKMIQDGTIFTKFGYKVEGNTYTKVA